MVSSNQQNILIAGLGVSGFEAALLAVEHYENIIVIDTFESTALQNRAACLAEKGVMVFTGADLKNIQLPLQPQLSVISPGIDPKSEFGQFISDLPCPLIGELEFAARYIETPLIGITGTNGKTTTVELITHCLKKLGKKAVAAGNIGLALSKVVRENNNYDFIVVEVSSFQLESVQGIQFKSAAILNISSDHVDRYDSFEEYGQTKLKILQHSEYQVISESVNNEWTITESIRPLITSTENQQADIAYDGTNIRVNKELFNYHDHPLQGIHNAENLMTAMAVLNQCGFPYKDVFQQSLTYKPAPHRMQLFLSKNGIKYINDSKATNPHALLMALNSLGVTDERNIVLIAGGRDKKMDFKIVNTALCSYTREVYIYGECRAGLYEVWKDKTRCFICDDFSEAVQSALKTVKQGEILLLSPGCSSLDSFRNYEDRGNEFVKTVQEWTENER